MSGHNSDFFEYDDYGRTKKFSEMTFEELASKVCGKARFSGNWQKTCESCPGNDNCSKWALLKKHLNGEIEQPLTEEKQDVPAPVKQKSAREIAFEAAARAKHASAVEKVQRCCELIRNGVPLDEASKAVGYSNYKSFSEARKKLGVENPLSDEVKQRAREKRYQDIRDALQRIEDGLDPDEAARSVGYCDYKSMRCTCGQIGIDIPAGVRALTEKKSGVHEKSIKKLLEYRKLVREGMKKRDAALAVGYADDEPARRGVKKYLAEIEALENGDIQ